MRTPAPISYLRLIVGIVFVAIGVFSVLGLSKDMITIGQDIAGLAIVFGVIEVVGGLALIIGVFTTFRIAIVQVLGLILFFTWIVKIILNILSLAVPGFPSTEGETFTVYGWVVSFGVQLTLLSALWVVHRDYTLL
jgi:hypothetical protein